MARLVSSISGMLKVTKTLTVTGDYSVTLNDFMIRANNPGPGALAVALPSIDATVRGHAFFIKKIDNNANITITSLGLDTFDGAASLTLSSQYQTALIIAPESGTDWAVLVFPVASGAGGATVGTATIDFGATATSSASIAVTGQTSILGTSTVTAFIQQDTTVDNDADDHLTLAMDANFYISAVTASTGFTINIFLPNFAAKGTYKVRWMWI